MSNTRFMTNRLLLASATCLLAVTLSCCAKGPTAEYGQGQTMKTETMFEGTTSAVRIQGVRIARNSADWETLWKEHSRTQLPAPELPEVDFENEMVLAVFLGERPTAGYGLHLERCAASDEFIVVEVHESSPDEGSMQAQMMTSPFVILTAPQSEGEAMLVFAPPAEQAGER